MGTPLCAMCDNDCCKSTKTCAWVAFVVSILLGIILTVISVPQAPERTFDKMAALTEMCFGMGTGAGFCTTPGGNVESKGTDANNNTVYEFKTTFEFRSALRSKGMWAASTEDCPVQSEFLGVSVVPRGSALLADVKPPPLLDVDKFTKPEHFLQSFDYVKKIAPAAFEGMDRKMFSRMIPDVMRLHKKMKPELKNIINQPDLATDATGKKLLAVDPILFCPITPFMREVPNEYKGPREGLIISKGSFIQDPDPVTKDTTFDNSDKGTEFKVTYPEVSGGIGAGLLLWTIMCVYVGQLRYPIASYDYGWQFGTNSVDQQYILKKGTFPATYAWGFSTGNMQILSGPDRGKHINEKEESDGDKDRTWVAGMAGWFIIAVVLQIPWIVISILMCCGKCKKDSAAGVIPTGTAVNVQAKDTSGGL